MIKRVYGGVNVMSAFCSYFVMLMIICFMIVLPDLMSLWIFIIILSFIWLVVSLFNPKVYRCAKCGDIAKKDQVICKGCDDVESRIKKGGF